MEQPESMTQYVTSLGEVWWGGILVAATLVVHALGMLWTLPGGIAGLIVTGWTITIVHRIRPR